MPDLKMPQINCVTLTGRLLRDPELKYGASGVAYLKTGVAVDDGFGDKKKTYFLDIAVFGKFAERVYPELAKGVPVWFQGRITIDQWTGKDGNKREKCVILCSQLGRLTWPEDGEVADPEPAAPVTEDDVPF